MLYYSYGLILVYGTQNRDWIFPYMKYAVVYLCRYVREKSLHIEENGRSMFTPLIFDKLSFLWKFIFIFVFIFSIFWVS